MAKKKEAPAAEGGAAEAEGGESSLNGAQGGAGDSVMSLRKGGNRKKTSGAQLRVQSDFNKLDAIPGVEFEFPNPDDIMNFRINVTPSEGLYKDATFVFEVNVPSSYPYDPPKVLCLTPVYHPNIDTEGHVCLNILRAEWSAVLSLGSVAFGLLTLFLEPNPDDPLNKEAADEFVDNYASFVRKVNNSLSKQRQESSKKKK